MNEYEQRSRRGRPPLPAEKVRGNRVVTFLTDSELAALQGLSRQANDTLSSTCHRIIADYLGDSSEPNI